MRLRLAKGYFVTLLVCTGIAIFLLWHTVLHAVESQAPAFIAVSVLLLLMIANAASHFGSTLELGDGFMEMQRLGFSRRINAEQIARVIFWPTKMGDTAVSLYDDAGGLIISFPSYFERPEELRTWFVRYGKVVESRSSKLLFFVELIRYRRSRRKYQKNKS